jgi:hypothetical protein
MPTIPPACIFRIRGGVRMKTVPIDISAVMAVASPSVSWRGTARTRKARTALAATVMKTKTCDVGTSGQVGCLVLMLAVGV